MNTLVKRSMLAALAAAASLPASSAALAGSASETAVLAGGCFWGMEAVFEHVKGVRSVVSGYAGDSRHAEAVRISYDSAQISYGQLLNIYVSIAHDPTQVNRQGPDVGFGYRSAIFPQNAGQGRAAEAFLARLSAAKAFPRPIATRIEGGAFSAAGAHHQDFVRRNPRHGYVVAHDLPKLAKLKRTYPSLWKA
jgi:peptide-methionine (S)-S-oxide reductase